MIDIDHILHQLSKGMLNADEVADILHHPVEYPKMLIEKLSTETALRYWNEEINYKAGDYIMNNIYFY